MSRLDRSDCKTLDNLTNMLNRLAKESNTKRSPLKNPRKPKGIYQRKSKSELDVSNSKLDTWLTKKVPNLSPSSPISSNKRNAQDTDSPDIWLSKRKNLEPTESYKETTSNSKASNCQPNINTLKKTPSKSSHSSNKTRKSPKTNKIDKQKSTKRSSSKAGGGASSRQTNLNQYLTKVSNKTLKRSDSSDSCELPTFSKLNRGTKVKKLTTTKKEQKALFKKYGVIVPTVDEILKDKEQLERDKNALKLFKPMSEDSLEFFDLFSEKICTKENRLDCKHLTEKQLSKQFKKNATFLNKIITGEVKNQRHDRYHNKNTNVLTHSLRDLTYNTSTILFSFEQTEYLLELLKTKFDPDDTKTQYFFQVLLPELCLKIFMNVHKMEHDEAVKYLDERPILED